MIQTGFEKRVQVQQILANQLPDYIRAESPKTLDFLKQYYISQEHQSGATDLADNLDQYIKIDNLSKYSDWIKDEGYRLFIACWIGKTRIIDNILLR